MTTTTDLANRVREVLADKHSAELYNIARYLYNEYGYITAQETFWSGN